MCKIYELQNSYKKIFKEKVYSAYKTHHFSKSTFAHFKVALEGLGKKLILIIKNKNNWQFHLIINDKLNNRMINLL